ncbi:StAR-related lipid transfer protein 7,mitochondrial [Strongyloides ratti]|uniref:Phosphatidylcholine transfer protein n=1 Tax=Strongyloides ratti TaxID=34506 RepID=A0A090KNW8_STRRB|nr:StAR-related lipid transfer protein 7,mitochondrial [Strongyloides ratti]CEF59278.1 StAR-related lipid transfer protein 7,mitochondrial [Strongyloides ratti]
MIGRFLKKISFSRLRVLPFIIKDGKKLHHLIPINKKYNHYDYNNNNKRIKYFPRSYLYALVGGFSGIFVNDDDKMLTEMLNENVKYIHSNDLAIKNLNEEQKKDGWELLHYQHGLKVLRRKRNFGGKELWEYRCIGKYDDISLCDFVDAQFDLNYRLSWDPNVSCLKQIYNEEYGKKAIVKWIAKFPWPMSSRLYIYKRLIMVDEENFKVILFSKGLNQTEYEDNDKNLVRVSNYISTMVVECIPGKGFFDNGINYILTYIDDPEAEIPNHLYDYIVKRSGPTFMDNVFNAAKKLHENRVKKKLNGENYKSLFTEFLNEKKEAAKLVKGEKDDDEIEREWIMDNLIKF